jgi:hypothetical protein
VRSPPFEFLRQAWSWSSISQNRRTTRSGGSGQTQKQVTISVILFIRCWVLVGALRVVFKTFHVKTRTDLWARSAYGAGYEPRSSTGLPHHNSVSGP